MSTPTARRAERIPQAVASREALVQYDSDQHLGRDDTHDPMEKDETEMELERLLFGDEQGFHERLRSHGTGTGVLVPAVTEEDGREEDVLEGEGLEGVDDADVCTFSESLSYTFFH